MLNQIRKVLRSVGEFFVAGALWKVVVLPKLAPGERLRYITVAAMVKNEGPYLKEWLDFHLRVGVEHFILYDNGSTDDTRLVCEPYLRAGTVTLIPWANFSVWFNQQRGAYAHALANFGARTFWMGFFDIDEFMFPVVDATLEDVLLPREHLPVLAVSGINFGTSGNRQRPAVGVLRGYRKAVPMEVQRRHRKLLETKCFVQPPRVAAVTGLHRFRIKNDRANGYNEHRQPLYGQCESEPGKMTVDIIRYNHYFTRSAEEFAAKVQGTDARGPRWSAGPRYYKRERFDLIESLATDDHVIDRLLVSDAPVASRRIAVSGGAPV